MRPDVAEAYDERDAGPAGRAAPGPGCDSWYRDGGRITTNWPGLVQEYIDRTAAVDWAELEEVS